MQPGGTLRRTKKEQTRQAIFVSGLTLFLEHGFDAVSVADIAAAAGVSKMTIFNYFPAKEDIFFLHADDVFPDFALVIRSRPPGEAVHDAIARYVVSEIDRRAEWLGLDETALPFTRTIEASTVLTDAVHRRWAAARDELVVALRSDPTAPGVPSDLAVVVAAQLLATVAAIGDACRSFMEDDPTSGPKRSRALACKAFGTLRA